MSSLLVGSQVFKDTARQTVMREAETQVPYTCEVIDVHTVKPLLEERDDLGFEENRNLIQQLKPEKY